MTNTSKPQPNRFGYIDNLAVPVHEIVAQAMLKGVQEHRATELEQHQALIIMLANELGTKRKLGHEIDSAGIFLVLEAAVPDDLSMEDRRSIYAHLLGSYADDMEVLVERARLAAENKAA